MAEVLPLSDAELRLLEVLVDHGIRFMVVGLSAAALQGAPVVTQDVDLWFESLGDSRLTKALGEIGAAYVPPFGMNGPMLAGAGADLFDIVIRMDGLKSFGEEFNHSIPVKIGKVSIRVLGLDRILASKEAANREKDRLVIPVLRNVLRTMDVRKNRNNRD